MIESSRIFASSRVVGSDAALVLELIYIHNPTLRPAQLDMGYLSAHLNISMSTVIRIIKRLRKKEYLTKHGRSEYSLSINFFENNTKYIIYEY
tara:strand:- start:27403 stop:27681 length:279 start_codon:yes stop_codon:yes gene_type:complete